MLLSLSVVQYDRTMFGGVATANDRKAALRTLTTAASLYLRLPQMLVGSGRFVVGFGVLKQRLWSFI